MDCQAGKKHGITEFVPCAVDVTLALALVGLASTKTMISLYMMLRMGFAWSLKHHMILIENSTSFVQPDSD